jgi:hypothetical protein
MKRESAELYDKIVNAVNPLLSGHQSTEAIESLTMLLAVGLCSTYELTSDDITEVYNTIVAEVSPRVSIMVKCKKELDNVNTSN